MPIEVYAFKNNENILSKSSSGGAFDAVVKAYYNANKEKYRLNESDMLVYGAAFDDDFNVVHKAAYSKDECKMFRGSKYVKSHVGNVYKEVGEHLLRGKAVLFSGTPCQVQALKNFLRSNDIETERLYLIDLICHGTPKPEIWSDYRKWIEKKYTSKITWVSFRDKSDKSKNYSIRINLQNGKSLVNKLETSLFTGLFLNRYIMEQGCYKCPFANLNRCGDITLGDFWGIEDIIPEFPKQDGVSEVLVNSQKGMILLEDIKKHSQKDKTFLKQCFSNEYIKYQNNLQKPAEKPKRLEEFNLDYKIGGFEYIIKKYVGYNYKGKLKYYIKKILKKCNIKKNI